MAALGDRCWCIAPDLPGLGASDEPPASFDFAREAAIQYIDELLDGFDVSDPVVLVVHDIGGVLGIPWAARHPERISGIVITNTVVFERFEWFPLAKLWSRTGRVGRLLAGAVMHQTGWFGGGIFRRAFGRISPELSSQDLDRITRMFALDAKSKRSTLRLFRRMVPTTYFDGFGAMVDALVASVPVRVVWGSGDPYIPARYAATFEPAPTELLETAGHWVPLSAPDRVASAVAELLPAREVLARAV
jgi:haloalkane dehalogenase